MAADLARQTSSPLQRTKVLALTDCALCQQTFTDPKLLPCLHSYCLTCLERASKDMRSGDKMPCPHELCSHPFIVPPASTGGLASLPRSYFVEKLIEINKISVCGVRPCQFCVDKSRNEISRSPDVPGSGNKLGSPSKRASVAPSKLYCMDCERNACSDCATEHAVHCPTHRVLPLEAAPKGAEGAADGAKFRPNYCATHRGEALRFHCYDCAGATLCGVCRDLAHRNHRCDDVGDVEAQFREQLQADLERVGERLPERTAARRRLEREVDRLNAKVGALCAAVTRSGEELKALVDGMTRALLDELRTVQRDRLRALEQVGAEVDAQLALLDGFRAYVSALKEQGTPCDVSRGVRDISAQAAQLAARRFSQYDDILNSFGITFEAAKTANGWPEESTTNLVGCIVVTDHGTLSTSTLGHHDSAADTPVSLHRVARLETDGRYVIGLTQLRDRLYAICGCSNSIRVYDVTLGYKRLDVIKVSKLKDPADLSACPVSNCLYVTDSGNSCVWRVSKLDKHGLGGKADKWLVGVGWPYKTSVTADGRVLVIGWSPSVINVHGADASRLRTVALPPQLDEPQNALETPSGTFIVTHGWTNSQVHEVVEVSAEGALLRSWGNSRGPSPRQLDLPCHIILDPRGRIFVADYNNARILFLDSSLQRGRVALSWAGDSIKEPRRLFFAPPGPPGSSPAGGNRLGGVFGSPSRTAAGPSKGLRNSGSGSPGGMGVANGLVKEFGRLLVGLGGAVDVYAVDE